MKKSITIFTMALGAILSISAIMPSQNASAVEKKPVHMDHACSKQYPGSTLVLVAQNVLGWKCRIYDSHGSNDMPIDVAKSCRACYSGAYKAGWEVYNDPYNWYCYK